MTVYKRESWGVATYRGGTQSLRQIAAAPGCEVQWLLGRPLTVTESRQWRKYGKLSVRA